MGIRISHIWFASKEELSLELYKKEKADLYCFHGVSPDFSYLEKSGGVQLSIIKDISLPEEDLFQTLGKHLRQYIKRSEKEKKAVIEIFDSTYLAKHPEIIVSCKTLYEKMFYDKGMKVKFNIKLMNKYILKDSMVIGFLKVDEEPVGFSAVIYKEKMARLWLAAYDFRNERIDSQVLSRAHQRLDWNLLLWCKNNGVKLFDFGGVNSFDTPDGIAKFKMSFEKKNKTEYYNFVIPNSVLGRLVVKLKRVIN